MSCKTVTLAVPGSEMALSSYSLPQVEPATKPEKVPVTEPPPAKPEHSPDKSPFRRPGWIKPGEEPNPKARG